MNNRQIGIGIAVVVGLGILFYFVQRHFADKAAMVERTTRQTEPAPRKVTRLSDAEAIKILHLAYRYADSVGIDTSRYALKSQADRAHIDTLLTRILLEIRYGKKPSRLAFSVKETIDSTWLNNADAALEPKSLAALSTFLPYRQLIGHYGRIRKETGNKPAVDDSLRLIRQTLNFYRYTNRFNPEQFVMVNIPAGELNVFDRRGDRLLPMQVIAGKPDRRTPCMTTYIQNIVMYPQWNVPEKIVQQEMLPRMKRSTAYIVNQNLQILDDRNREIEPSKINWRRVSAKNFPYRVRQASGCHNSLGLLKFNLVNPLEIYLHDTNTRDLFNDSTDRWRSHGCVRVQKPVELANLVLGNKVFDDEFMEKCLIDQKPRTLPIPKQVPVFITYNVADVDESGQLRFYKDVYELDDK